ncbi:MAG: hypothetical protein KDC38_10550 [Planctomycetes bacterium]|nr:hypothetical protein [Planctomycetota bacterium]
MRPRFMVRLVLLSILWPRVVLAQDVLLLELGSPANHVSRDAVIASGGTPLVTTAVTTFNSMLGSGAWDVVIVEAPSGLFTDTADLETYIAGDGKALVQYSNLDVAPASLRSALGVASASDRAIPLAIHPTGHPALSGAVVDVVDLGAGDYGDDLTPTGSGTLVATSRPGGTGRGLIVAANEDRTLCVGQEWETLDEAQAEAACAELIEYLLDLSPTVCAPVENLLCTIDCSSGDAELSWTNGGVYTDVEIDGVSIGVATAAARPLVPGATTFSVVGVCGADRSVPRLCTVEVPDDEWHVVWAAEEASSVDSVTALTDALDRLSLPYGVVDTLPTCPLGPGHVIWCATGTYPDSHPLTVAEGSLLVDHLESGTAVYFEGSRAWTSGPVTEFQSYDGVAPGAIAGDDTLVGLVGFDVLGAQLAGLDASYTSDQLADQTDRIEASTVDAAGADAGVAWRSDGSVGGGNYGVAVFYDTSPGLGHVFSSSFEFGGFDGDRSAYLQRILDAFAPPPLTLNAQYDCEAHAVAIDWTLDGGSSVTSVRCLRDGFDLPGSPFPAGTLSVVDSSPPVGLVTYSVQVACSHGGVSSALSIDVDTNPFIPGNVILDLEGAGAIDSSAVLASAFDALCVDYLTVTDVDDLPCGVFTSSQCVWVLCGTYPDNTALSPNQGVDLKALVEAGGSVYLEGGDVWGSDVPTAFSAVDGVADIGIDDGDDSFEGMVGVDYLAALLGGLDAPYVQDQSTDDSTDRLVPAVNDLLGSNAGLIWLDDGSGGGAGYGTGVYYAGDDGGRVISVSWEFGGYGGDPVLLLQRYRSALCEGAVDIIFRRGDVNGDEAFDIADAIAILSFLFPNPPPGEPLPCADAGDTNDDGFVDIGDAIFALSALFSGGRLPPSPGAMDCGEDPTADALACVFSPCI